MASFRKNERMGWDGQPELDPFREHGPENFYHREHGV